MGELTLKGLDQSVLDWLSSEAAAHGRSVGEEAEAIILASAPSRVGHSDVWERLAESRRQTGRLDIRTIDLLREDRDSRDIDH